MRTPLLVEIDVQALVVLQVAQAQHIFVGEIVEGLQDVAQPQDRAEQGEEIFLRLFSDDFLAQGEPLEQLRDLLGVCSEIFRIWFKHHRALGVLVPEQSQGVIHLLPQIAEADDVAEGLHRVQDAVGAAERLHQAMLLQVLVHPQGVERRGVEAGEQHVHHDGHVQIAVLEPEAQILVVVLELVGGRAEAAAERSVVIADRGVEEIP